MSSPIGTFVVSSSSTPAPSVCGVCHLCRCGLCYRPFCGVARVYMPNCGFYLHTRCFVDFHIWHLNLEYMEGFFDAWHQHHMQGEGEASFRFRRHRKEMYWAELRCRTRFVETWRRQYLTRHALDLWYIFTVRDVSARAEKALNLVRDWQRSEWDEWLARFLYLRDKALAVAILHAWKNDACPPPLWDSMSEGPGLTSENSPTPSSTSSSTSSYEWFPPWLEEIGFDPFAVETNLTHDRPEHDAIWLAAQKMRTRAKMGTEEPLHIGTAAASPSSTPAPSSRIRMVNGRRKGRRERISAFRHALRKRTS